MFVNKNYNIGTFAVVIASHIFNQRRIEFLLETLLSIIKQTYKSFIYLSISFEKRELEEIFLKHILENEYINNWINTNQFLYFIQNEKTSQMQHFHYICSHIREQKLNEKKNTPEWILFSDDDDTYLVNRIEKFAKLTEVCLLEMNSNKDVYNDKVFAGIYESTFGKNHTEHRHEFWCYCVRFSILSDFYNRIENYQYVIDNKCCDILFAEYLRRLNPKYMFSFITDNLYNYRRGDENNESVTGTIMETKEKIVRKSNPPPLDDEKFTEYIFDWNDYLHDNLHIYLHDTFLRTVVGCSFDTILKAEFLLDYPYLDYIDEIHVNKLKFYYDCLRTICMETYDVKF
jgi:hypothetical protein